MPAIAVDDEAGQAVAFTPNKAAEIGVDAGKTGAGVDGALNAAEEKVGIEILLPA